MHCRAVHCRVFQVVALFCSQRLYCNSAMVTEVPCNLFPCPPPPPLQTTAVVMCQILCPTMADRHGITLCYDFRVYQP